MKPFSWEQVNFLGTFVPMKGLMNERRIKNARESLFLSITHTSNMHFLNCSQLSGLIAQLVEHCTGITEVMGLNPVEAV